MRALASASPALAQQQTVNFTIGGFVPRGEDARVAGDVLTENRTFLVFDIDEFKSVTAGAEWLFPIGGFVEGGAGVSFTQPHACPRCITCCVDNNGERDRAGAAAAPHPDRSDAARRCRSGASSPVQVYFGGGARR